MKNSFKRLFAAFIAVVVAIGLAAVPATKADAAVSYNDKLVVIHTNDIHGAYEKSSTSLGISSIRALRKYYEDRGANVLVVDAGDFSQGANLVNYFKGMSAYDFLNLAGYDVVSLGNHEFDFGSDVLLANASKAEFKILDANILSEKTGEPLFEGNTVYTFDNMKVGVFGLDTPEAQTKANPKNIKGIKFLGDDEMMACAQSQVDTLKEQGCDYIICVGHLGMDIESIGNRSLDVLARVKGIDLFVDGHSHSVIKNGYDINGTKLVSTGTGLNNIGVVVFDGKETKATLLDSTFFAGGCPGMDDFVKSYQDIVDKAYAGKFATSTVALDGNKAPGVRTQETNLGDFAADAYKFIAEEYVKDNGLNIKIDGAIQNGGGIRASVAPGDISMKTLYTVFPFGNTINIVTVTGAELLEALEASCHVTPEAIGGFPQVSGIEFTINTAVPYLPGAKYPNSTYYAPAKPGSRVTIASVGGEKFDLKKTYNIAVNNFMADGGDTYYVFSKASKVMETSILDADGLVDFAKSLNCVIGEEYAAPQGRITIK